MGRTRVERWEARLKTVFDEIDAELEAMPHIHGTFRRHPNRPPARTTANPEDDGLFDIGAAFTVGIGSTHGPGYVLSARIATLDPVTPDQQQRLDEYVVRRLREKLPTAFPHSTLTVSRDGHIFKIHGDLSLGTL